MLSKHFDAVVLERRDLTDRIAEFRIGAADGARLPMAEAGSHIEVCFAGRDGSYLRHYSVVGPLDLDHLSEPFWRIAVQRENRPWGSAFIHDHFKVGTRLRVSRPINMFKLARHPGHTLLVAGGIGITPIFSMARSLQLRKADFSVLYVGFDRAGMAFVDELERLCDGRLTLQETKLTGRPDFRTILVGQRPGTIAYVCGPVPMIEALRGAGAALGWSDEQLRFEVFNAAHRGDDRDFNVRTKTGRTIKVGAGQSILEALERERIDTLSDCRRGECGLCVTHVVRCDGALDHRDRFFGDDERAAGDQITICCSRITGQTIELDI